jgi:hypothetical protein
MLTSKSVRGMRRKASKRGCFGIYHLLDELEYALRYGSVHFKNFAEALHFCKRNFPDAFNRAAHELHAYKRTGYGNFLAYTIQSMR